MDVAVIQMEPRLLERDENFETMARLLAAVAHADIVVLPELCPCGYAFSSQDEVDAMAEDAYTGPTSSLLQDLARENEQVIACGYAERKGDAVYNAQLLVGPGGVMASYRKVHLFNTEKSFFSPGNAFYVSPPYKGIRMGLMVCFDWFFPESMRTLMLMGADIVLHSANLVLPYCPDAMVTRCLENRVYAVTSNRIGYERGLHFIGSSQITAPDGTIMRRLSREKEEAATACVDPCLAHDKHVTARNDILQDRAVGAYRL